MQKFLSAGICSLLSLSMLAACDTHKAASEDLRGQCVSGIVGGREVSKEEVLAQKVVLLIIKKAEGGEACTGTPIEKDVILTAAHCVKDANSIAAAFTVDAACSSGFRLRKNSIAASSWLIHPRYYSSEVFGIDNDVALIRLKSAIPEDYEVSKVYDGKSPITSDILTLIGFGKTSELKANSFRLNTTYKSIAKEVELKDNFVSFAQEETGVCSGDSGGPVFVDVNGEKQVYGVNSYVTGPKETYCHGKGHAQYATTYIPWILETIPTLE